MEKPAETTAELNDLILRRWSPRAFSDRPIEAEKITALLEAARWAPSCYNDQPWHFLIAERNDPPEFERLLGCLMEGNQAWARRAPLLMVSVTRLHFTHNGRPNRYAWHDVGLAVENMVIQGMAMGIFCHQMAGFHADLVRERFSIPEGFEPVTAIAAGYPGDPALLPAETADKEGAPRSRKGLETFVFSGAWGRPAPLFKGAGG